MNEILHPSKRILFHLILIYNYIPKMKWCTNIRWAFRFVHYLTTKEKYIEIVAPCGAIITNDKNGYEALPNGDSSLQSLFYCSNNHTSKRYEWLMKTNYRLYSLCSPLLSNLCIHVHINSWIFFYTQHRFCCYTWVALFLWCGLKRELIN